MLIPLKDSNPLRWIGFPYVTVALIAACVLAFLWQVSFRAKAFSDDRTALCVWVR